MEKQSVYSGYYQNPETENMPMDIFAYNPPTDGNVCFDGRAYKGFEDFRTVEQYQTYKRCGMNVLLAQSWGAYGDEAWEESDAKKVLDACHKAGVQKAVLLDKKLYALSQADDGVIGQDKAFASEAELEKFVAQRLQAYSGHPAFYGVELASDLAYTQFKALGQVYKAIKRVYPKTFIHTNLAMMQFTYGEGKEPPYGEENDYNQRYEAYVNAFFDATGADCVGAEMLPYEEGWSEGLYVYYFRQWQILKKVAKERGAQLQFTLQAWGQYQQGKMTHRLPSKQEMWFQLHAAMGFGAKKLAYKQYWSGADNALLGAFNPSGWAMMTADGQPTALYEQVQALNQTAKKLAPVLANFEHVSETYAALSSFRSKPMHIKYTLRNLLTRAHLVTSQEMAMAYELYDAKRKQYLYVLQNVTCPLFGAGLPKQTSTITFDGDYTKVDVFDGNDWHTEHLTDGAYTVDLDNGDAVYLLPY